MRRWIVFGVCVVLALATMGSVGCSEQEPEPEDTLVPRIEPPLIGEAGVLRAGVDLSYPPYAGTDKEQNAGIDVDIASAIAANLGLHLEIVDVTLDGAREALERGDVDVVFSIPFNEEYATAVRFAGSYLNDAPVVFVRSGEGPDALGQLGAGRVGVQFESESYWWFDHGYGAGFAVASPTLREAFDALVAGEVDAVACDGAVGAYIARDMDGIAFSFQLDDARPVGVAVGLEAEEFETEVRALIDALQADGVVDTIRTKWLGDLPKLELPEASGI